MNSPTTDLLEPELASPAGSPGLSGLWQRYHRDGDLTEENELVERYLPLVKTVVGRLAMTLPSHVNQDELQSAGLVGLLQAVRKYDPHCRTAFETYARARIKGAVLDELRRMDWVPRLIHDKTRKIQNTLGRLEQELGHTPTEAQMAAALHLSLAEYQRWLEEIRPATYICLDAACHAGNGDSATLYESIADETQDPPDRRAARRELADLIVKRLDQLPDIQRRVLALYYFEDLRLREIAAIFHLTESRICQIHSQAILALRAFLEKREASPALSPA